MEVLSGTPSRLKEIIANRAWYLLWDVGKIICKIYGGLFRGVTVGVERED